MKNKKGITLVALIITIIVMLILAGVAISMVMGDNGVVSQAENATERQKYAVAEEKIRTQSEFITQGENAGKVDLAQTEENINNLGLGEVKETKIEGNTLKVTLSNNSVVEIAGVNLEEGNIDDDQIESNQIIGVYGSTVLDQNDDGYVGFEFKENGIGYFYDGKSGEKNDLTYNENTLSFKIGEDLCNLNYSFLVYKDETTGEILNKVISIPDMYVTVTTNGSIGFCTLDGKRAKDNSSLIRFENGFYYERSASHINGVPYGVFDGIIYEEGYSNIYWRTHYIVNSELNKLIEQDDEGEIIHSYDLVEN